MVNKNNSNIIMQLAGNMEGNAGEGILFPSSAFFQRVQTPLQESARMWTQGVRETMHNTVYTPVAHTQVITRQNSLGFNDMITQTGAIQSIGNLGVLFK